MATQFDLGFLVGLLVGEGHFGGDGRQPHVTLRMHVRHQAIFDWLQRTFPGGRVYGPYHHGGRDYLQWMARGAFLRDELAPVLDQFLSPDLDQHSFDRYQSMRASYPQLAAGPDAPALPPDRSRRPASQRTGSQQASPQQAARSRAAKAGSPPGGIGDLADLFAELREAWPS
jgi:hypothetical protein